MMMFLNISCCTYVIILLEFEDKFFFWGRVYIDMIYYDLLYYDYRIFSWIFFLFSLKFFAKVERCRLQNTVESLGKLCYGRAYLDFSPRRLVSCGSPLA